VTSSSSRLTELENACDDFQREVELELIEFYEAHEIARAAMVEKYGVERIEKFELKIKNQAKEAFNDYYAINR